MFNLNELYFDDSQDAIPWRGESLDTNVKERGHFQLESKTFREGANFGRQWTLQKDPMVQELVHRLCSVVTTSEEDHDGLESFMKGFLEYTKDTDDI